MRLHQQRALSHDNIVSNIVQFCIENDLNVYQQDKHGPDRSIRMINTMANYSLRHQCDLIVDNKYLVEVKTTKITSDNYGAVHTSMEFASYESMMARPNVYIIDSNRKMYPLIKFMPYQIVIFTSWKNRDEDNFKFCQHCDEYAQENNLQIVEYPDSKGSGTPLINGSVKDYDFLPNYEQQLLKLK